MCVNSSEALRAVERVLDSSAAGARGAAFNSLMDAGRRRCGPDAAAEVQIFLWLYNQISDFIIKSSRQSWHRLRGTDAAASDGRGGRRRRKEKVILEGEILAHRVQGSRFSYACFHFPFLSGRSLCHGALVSTIIEQRMQIGSSSGAKGLFPVNYVKVLGVPGVKREAPTGMAEGAAARPAP